MRSILIKTLAGGLLCGLLSLTAHADTKQLYIASGMQEHQDHFQHALAIAHQRYAAQLPASIADSLMRQSSQRFAPEHMYTRALTSLSTNLPAEHLNAALAFYRSELGQRVVAAETRATSPEEISRLHSGVPMPALSPARQALIDRLGRQLPALDMGEEVSMALAGLATQSANEMLGGLLTIPDELAGQRRSALRAQLEPGLGSTLAYVYRDLSDSQLDVYATWSESQAGRVFFHAVNLATRDALTP